VIQRVISTVGLWAVVILSLVLFKAQGGIWLIVAFAALTQYEFYKLLRKIGYPSFSRLSLILGSAIVLGAYYCPEQPLTALALVVAGCACVTRVRSGDALKAFLASASGIIYIPFCMSYLILPVHLVADEMTGLLIGFWIVVTAKFSDAGGYIVGTAFGRHKLAPTVSPGKTWEGAGGGVLASVVVGTALVAVLPSHFPSGFLLWKVALAAIPIASVAIVSDLIESMIKREAGAKDSGAIIPGLGGFFDLIDSLILSAPVAYAIVLNFFL
jgi:phosphatidate cytidylyltransferase